jgi:hypothetical protein
MFHSLQKHTGESYCSLVRYISLGEVLIIDASEYTLVWHIDKLEQSRLHVSDSEGVVSVLTRVNAVPAQAICHSLQEVRRFEELEHRPYSTAGLADDGSLLWFTDNTNQEWSIDPDSGLFGSSIDIKNANIEHADGLNFWVSTTNNPGYVELRDRNDVKSYGINVFGDYKVSPYSVAFDAQSKVLFVAGVDNTIYQYVLLKFNVAVTPAELLEQVDFVSPSGMAFGNGALWIVHYNGSVTKLDPTTLRATRSFKSPNPPGQGSHWFSIAVRDSRIFMVTETNRVSSLVEFKDPGGQ